MTTKNLTADSITDDDIYALLATVTPGDALGLHCQQALAPETRFGHRWAARTMCATAINESRRAKVDPSADAIWSGDVPEVRS